MHIDILRNIELICDYPNTHHFWWYNLNNGKMYRSLEIQNLFSLSSIDEDELYARGFIPFFEFPSIIIEKEFIKMKNDKKLSKKLLSLRYKEFSQAFGKYVEANLYLYRRWHEYRKKTF